jgi:DNA repair exonuclease SbcCD ATPase subunit
MRFLGLWTLTAAVALAQNAPAPTLASLAQTALKKTADWDTLAQGLEALIGRLLPCDSKGPAAIEEVSRTSDARLAALADYLQAAAQQASRDTDAAKRVLASSGTLATNLEAEKTEITQEQAGADSEFANLVESAKSRASLNAPRDALQEIRTELQQRADLVQAAIGGQESLAPALRDLVTAAAAREAAWKDVQTAYEAERARWKAYYAARLARAQTECSIVKGTAPARSKGKQP